MGTETRAAVDIDVKGLIDLLNKAFADEWLAYYQYWIGAKRIKGPMREAAVAELEEHAGDELKHAGMLAERIMQLEGTPVLKPEEWYKMTNCGYDAPQDPSVEAILEQNVKSEQCAIDVYKGLIDATREKDPVTQNMAREILEDEVEHKKDLQAILEDLGTMKSSR